MQYEDFIIEILPGKAGEYQARAHSQSGNGHTSFVPPSVPTSWLDLSDLTPAQERHLAGEPMERAADRPERLGEQLFNALFSGDLLRLYDRCLERIAGRRGYGLRLKLVTDPRNPSVAPVQALPWELMRQPNTPNYLVLHRDQSFVRHLAIPRPIENKPWPHPLRILCVRSNPGGGAFLDLKGELDALREALAGIGEVIEPETPTLDGVRKALLEQECHVLHFMGHGEEDATQGILWFESGSVPGAGEPIRGEDLANKIADVSSLRLVVLNACESARTGFTWSSSIAGVASALVLGGLPAVVAMQAPISDRAAIAFSRSFYQRLAAGDPLDAAVTEGRQQVHSLAPDGFEWATPVLFLRTFTAGSDVIPQFARSFLRVLPPGLVSRLRLYRRDEIRGVQDFLGSPEKKLLCLLGAPGVGASELLQICILEAPPGVSSPILWKDCEETDSLASLAEEWARAFGDQKLALLTQQRTDRKTGPDSRELDREIVAWLLARLERFPQTIVLSRFDRWLSPAGQEIRDPALANFLARVVEHPQTGKLILQAEEKPVLPPDLHPSWVETLVVQGLAPADALDFLQNFLGVHGTQELLGRVAARLEGHPLALQLLAGSLAHLTAAEQAERLRQFLGVGEGTFSSSPLRPLLESAHSRLQPREAQVLDLLTAVRQPLTLGEIEEIGAGRSERLTSDEVRRTVDRLVHERYWTVSLHASPGQPRFGPTQIGRPYLEERLAEDRAWKTELHRRAFIWYRRKYPVSDMDSTQQPEPEAVASYDELIYQALTLAELTSGEESQEAAIVGGEIAVDRTAWYIPNARDRQGLAHLERAQRLLGALPTRDAQLLAARCLEECGELYSFHERYREAEKTLRDALSLARALEDKHRQGFSLLALGDLYSLLDRIAEAESCYREALLLFRGIESRIGQARAVRDLGQLHLRMHRLSEAGEAISEALTLYQMIEGRQGEAIAKIYQGTLYRLLDDLSEAEICLQQALQIFRRLGDALDEANTLYELGSLYLRADRIREAENSLNTAMRIYREIEYRGGEINALGQLGALFVRMGRKEEAERYQRAALQLFRAIGDRLGEANTLLGLGASLVQRGRPAEAEELDHMALALYRAIEYRLGEANAAFALGGAYFLLDRLGESEKNLNFALRLFRELGSRMGEANTLSSLGVLHQRKGLLPEAEMEIKGALALFRDVECPPGEVNTLVSLGDLYDLMDQLPEAEACYRGALALAKTIDFGIVIANSLRSLGDIYIRTKRLTEAEDILAQALSFSRSTSLPALEALTLQSLGRLEFCRECAPEAEARFLEALPLFRANEDRLNEAITLCMLGMLRGILDRLVEAEEDLLTARAFFHTADVRQGLINCALGLSTVNRKNGRYPEAVAEALTALLHEMSGTRPEMDEVVARFALLRIELGGEELDRLILAALEGASSEIREAVSGVLTTVVKILDEELLEGELLEEEPPENWVERPEQNLKPFVMYPVGPDPTPQGLVNPPIVDPEAVVQLVAREKTVPKKAPNKTVPAVSNQPAGSIAGTMRNFQQDLEREIAQSLRPSLEDVERLAALWLRLRAAADIESKDGMALVNAERVSADLAQLRLGATSMPLHESVQRSWSAYENHWASDATLLDFQRDLEQLLEPLGRDEGALANRRSDLERQAERVASLRVLADILDELLITDRRSGDMQAGLVMTTGGEE